jgi:hypothetical protein
VGVYGRQRWWLANPRSCWSVTLPSWMNQFSQFSKPRQSCCRPWLAKNTISFFLKIYENIMFKDFQKWFVYLGACFIG